MRRRAAVRQIVSVQSQQVETPPSFMAVNRPETEGREQCRDTGPDERSRLALSIRDRLWIGLDLAGSTLARKLDGVGDQRACDAEAAPASRDIEAVQRPGRRLPGANQRLAAIQSRKVGARRHRAPAHRLVVDEGEHTLCAAFLYQRAERLAVRSSLGGLPGLAAHRHAPPHAPATAARAVLAEQALDERPVVATERARVDRHVGFVCGHHEAEGFIQCDVMHCGSLGIGLKRQRRMRWVRWGAKAPSNEGDMRYRMNGLVVAVRCVLLGTVLVVAGCGGGGGGGGGNVRPDAPPAVTPPPPPPPTPVVFAPNPAYSQHLALTNTTAAHSAGLTGHGSRIGVVDSGVMRNHPALSPRVLANLNYVSSPPNNLAIDDVVGHGTAVSQIMAGTPFGAWPGGIAPGAQIISARIISDKEPTDDGSGQGNAVNGALGLKPIHQDLINRGVRIMNNSWGGVYWTDPAATAAIADEYRPFIQSNGGLVVFANGNESRANPSSLAALPSQLGPGGSRPAADLERGWLAVAALDDANPTQLASYSN